MYIVGVFVCWGVFFGHFCPTVFEVQGTASASYLLTGNTLQVGGYSSVAYSRFGIVATTHGLSASNDLLINGKLEVDGSVYFDGTVNFPSIASASLFYAQAGTAASPSFSFGTDQDTGMFRPTVNQLGFSTLGVERMRINNSGNVGINSGNNVDTTLEVGGTASISSTLTLGGIITSSNTGSNSFSGGLEVTKGVHATGSITTGNDLRVNGNTNIYGIFVLGDNGDVGSINTSDWDITTDGAITGVSFDANGTGNSISNIDNADLTADTLDFTAISDSPTLDADLNIQRAGFKIGLGQAPATVFEVQGTASASYLLTGNTLQVGGYSSVAYSRFGTDATSHTNYITTTNDVLISGGLEVNSSAAFDSHMAIGNATDGTDLLYINSQIKSNVISFTNTFDIGSSTNRWRTVFTDKIDATELTGASTSFGGTNNETFTINADNSTADTENSQFFF